MLEIRVGSSMALSTVRRAALDIFSTVVLRRNITESANSDVLLTMITTPREGPRIFFISQRYVEFRFHLSGLGTCQRKESGNSRILIIVQKLKIASGIPFI